MSIARALLVLALVAPSASNAQELGRLFFTPEQRQALDARRKARVPDKPAATIVVSPTTRVDGFVKRSGGPSTVWVNGEALPEGSSALLQKPMGENLAEAQRIRELCERKRIIAAVNFQLRFSPNMLALAHAVQRGAVLAGLCQRGGQLLYRSALVVREGSSITTVADLVGRRAAWTNPSSAGGYLVPRLALVEALVVVGEHAGDAEATLTPPGAGKAP